MDNSSFCSGMADCAPLSHAAHALNQSIKHLRILLNGRWSVEKLSIAAALRVPLLHKHLG
ncbi:hypothetical protein ACHAWO_011712 [Cyclotella atomus]|uniref:Uncharacterized protein n=1 Tax=Cyclotella atomus TaxID=382360 RepID=A0ABD3P425_9STRA